MISETDESRSGVYIQLPLPDTRLFRNQATEDILRLFIRNPHSAFTASNEG